MMPRCLVDKSLKRVELEGVAFPLGVYPVEEMKPRTGYTIHFEPADGSDEGEWEEWPDRYVYDIFVSATRVETLVRMLFALLPGRVYPILDVLGQDEYREIDPYVAYDLVSQERVVDAMRRYRGFFFEDGLVGFGAMSEEPFLYIFVDEHKIVTVRVETSFRERVEKLLTAFDLTEVEEIAGADAATHEHRTVLVAPETRPDLATVEEIVEELRDEWGMVINLDPETNVDDEGNELGITAWRCIARHEPNDGEAAGAVPPEPVKEGAKPAEAAPRSRPRYAEIYLAAESLSSAERLLWEAIEDLTGTERSPDAVDVAVSMDRVRPEVLELELAAAGKRGPDDGPLEFDEPRVVLARWLE